jgi:hypothetical protein
MDIFAFLSALLIGFFGNPYRLLAKKVRRRQGGHTSTQPITIAPIHDALKALKTDTFKSIT